MTSLGAVGQKTALALWARGARPEKQFQELDMSTCLKRQDMNERLLILKQKSLFHGSCTIKKKKKRKKSQSQHGGTVGSMIQDCVYFVLICAIVRIRSIL